MCAHIYLNIYLFIDVLYFSDELAFCYYIITSFVSCDKVGLKVYLQRIFFFIPSFLAYVCVLKTKMIRHHILEPFLLSIQSIYVL